MLRKWYPDIDNVIFIFYIRYDQNDSVLLVSYIDIVCDWLLWTNPQAHYKQNILIIFNVIDLYYWIIKIVFEF